MCCKVLSEFAMYHILKFVQIAVSIVYKVHKSYWQVLNRKFIIHVWQCLKRWVCFLDSLPCAESCFLPPSADVCSPPGLLHIIVSQSTVCSLLTSQSARPPPAAAGCVEVGNFREVGDSHFRNFDSEKRDRKIWWVGGKHQNNNW